MVTQLSSKHLLHVWCSILELRRIKTLTKSDGRQKFWVYPSLDHTNMKKKVFEGVIGFPNYSASKVFTVKKLESLCYPLCKQKQQSLLYLLVKRVIFKYLRAIINTVPCIIYYSLNSIQTSIFSTSILLCCSFRFHFETS